MPMMTLIRKMYLFYVKVTMDSWDMGLCAAQMSRVWWISSPQMDCMWKMCDAVNGTHLPQSE